MNTKYPTRILIAALAAMGATSTFAHHSARAEAQQVIELKDGSTLYVFADGKMAMADRYGRAARMAPGVAMETSDGKKISMLADEVARLDSLINDGHLSGD